jgi:hypothetical protein
MEVVPLLQPLPAGEIIAKNNSLATYWLQKVVTAPVLHLLHLI